MSPKKTKKKKKAPSKSIAPSTEDEASQSESEDGTSFADLMSDARRITPGPQRLPNTASVSPAVARALASRGSAESKSATFRWPDPQDRGRAAAEGVPDIALFALGRGDPEPEERIDLHGTRRDAAPRLISKRLESARSRGLRCILIVHGHGKSLGSGEAVLKQKLPEWLSRRPSAEHVLAFAPAPRDLGGAGATLVLLRRR